MIKLRKATLIAAPLALLASVAVADLVVKDGNSVSQTLYNYVCQTSKLCAATVIIDSTGAEIGTSILTAIQSGSGSTGAAVPASAIYNGINVGGTLRAQTGVNSTGSVYATQVDIASIGGISATAANFGVGTVGSAPVPYVAALGANASGATGGLMKGLITCDATATYDASTSGKTTLVGGVSGRKIYICGFQIGTGSTATNVSIGDGTGSNCVTTYTAITPVYQLAALDRTGMNSPFWNGLVTLTAGDNLCVSTSAGNAVQVTLFYTVL